MGDNAGFLHGLAGSGAEPVSQSMGFYELKFSVVGAVLNVDIDLEINFYDEFP